MNDKVKEIVNKIIDDDMHKIILGNIVKEAMSIFSDCDIEYNFCISCYTESSVVFGADKNILVWDINKGFYWHEKERD